MGRGATITHNGETLSIQEWADKLGISRNTIKNRMQRGYPMDQVLSPYPIKRGGISSETALKNMGPADCCLPDCENCPLPDCCYGGAPTREESRRLRDAMIRLPDTRSGFDHVYRSVKKSTGIVR